MVFADGSWNIIVSISALLFVHVCALIVMRWRRHYEVAQTTDRYERVLARLNEEMQGRESAVIALRQAEEKFRKIFENAYEGIFQTTPQGNYLAANPALAKMYGYDSTSHMMESIGDIESQLYVDDTRRDEFARLLAEDDTVTNFESEVYRQDGSTIWISENARAVRDDRGALLYYEGTVVDITERKQGEAMRRQIEMAEAANHAKSDFLAKMSHEIRTPLNGVIGMLDLLSTNHLTTQQDRYVRIAKSSADSLLTLINDILDFSKIEAGKLELEKADFDLPLALEDVAEMFVHRAQAKNLELTCHIRPDVPRRVLGDPERLRQIISNLVNNAIKFTTQGEVEIRAELKSTEAKVSVIRLSVRDTGIGIPESARHRLFNSFSQVDASTSRKYGGTGLGLAICKQLVDLMKGSIGADSVEGKGSTFWCEIPLEVVSIGAQPTALPCELANLKVLAVDDIDTNLEILQEQFERWGVPLVTTSCATDALGAMHRAAKESSPFGLVIVDQLMPDMNGTVLADVIQKHENLRGTPLLLLSSLDGVVSGDEAIRLGFVGCMTKPIRQSRLFDAVVSAAMKQPKSKPVKKDSKPQPVAREGKILVTDDNEINQLVACEILRTAGYKTIAVSSGKIALEALQCEPFDLVLMDCEMPEWDGCTTTRHIRKWEASESAKPTPIIALTANAVAGDQQRCFAAGMNDYVTKPIDRVRLLAVIAKWLNHPQDESATAAVTDSAATTSHEGFTSAANESSICAGPPLDPAIVNWKELMERSMNDEEFAGMVLNKFSERLPKDIGQLEQALSDTNIGSAVKLAHSIKGAAANVSAHALRDAAALIERQARMGIVSTGECLRALSLEATKYIRAIETMPQSAI